MTWTTHSRTMPRAPGPPRRRVVLVGVLAGAASGLFGVGGGIVIVPALVLVAAFGQRLAHGTSLTAIVPIAVAGTIGYAAAGEVDVGVAALVAAGAVVGTPLGAAALPHVPASRLRVGFALLLLATAGRMVMETGSGSGREAIDVMSGMAYLATGVCSGILAGLMGVGGGIVIVPLLTIVFGFPIALAKGTSLAIIVPAAAAGTVRNVRQGTTDLGAGLLVGASGVATALAASQVSLGLSRGTSAVLFGALLCAVAVRMLRRAHLDPNP